MSDILLDGHVHRGCGGHYAQVTVPVTIRLSGMAATVSRSAYRCDVCGDEQRTLEQREAAEQAALETMRGEHRLLTPREVRKLRESLGLTTEVFGALLYGTPRGVIEGWEKGRYVQNPETDAMMRSLADRAVLERRAAKSGVTLPPLPGTEPTLAPVVPVADAMPVESASPVPVQLADMPDIEPAPVEPIAAAPVVAPESHDATI